MQTSPPLLLCALQADVWNRLNQAASHWAADTHGALHLTLAKHPDCLASWPHVFQSIAARQTVPNSPSGLEIVWREHRGAFEATADLMLEARLAEGQALKAAFVQAVQGQMAGGMRMLPGQILLSFPSEDCDCLAFVRSAQHLPAVAKLLHIIRQVSRSQHPSLQLPDRVLALLPLLFCRNSG